jgi:WD40 repeat protein
MKVYLILFGLCLASIGRGADLCKIEIALKGVELASLDSWPGAFLKASRVRLLDPRNDGRPHFFAAWEKDSKQIRVFTSKRKYAFDMFHAPAQGRNFHRANISAAAIHPDGHHIVSGDVNGELIFSELLWNDTSNLSSWVATRIIPSAHHSEISAIAYSLDGKRVVSHTGETTADIWDSHTGNFSHSLSTDIRLRDAAFIGNDGLLLTGTRNSEDFVEFWDINAKQAKWNSSLTSVMQSFHFAPKIASVPRGNFAVLWDFLANPSRVSLLDGTITPLKTGPWGLVEAATVSDSGKWAAAAFSSGVVAIWDLNDPGANKKVIKAPDFKSPDNTFFHVSFSHDERWVWAIDNVNEENFYAWQINGNRRVRR